MTQEEKARAYDEALKRARALRQEAIDKEYAIDYVKDYEAIFPELAESEDERIRKKIIENVRLSGGYTDEEIDEMISWLEKQKEQKVDIDKLRRDLYQSGYNDGYQHGKEDAQKERKSAEWSEEDEDMLNSCISSIEEAKENRYAYKETDGDTSYDHEIAWLKFLRPQGSKDSLQTHWKPSEEQMKALQNAVALTACDKELARLYNQLKKL